MYTIILAGGQGTRLGDITQVTPKPMLPIGNYPILEHVMRIYSYYNHRDFILCLGYLGKQIKDYFNNYYLYNYDCTLDFDIAINHKPMLSVNSYSLESELSNWKITFANTGLKTETGGRVYQVIKYLDKNEPTMITYADGVANIDLNKLVEFHKKQGKLGTITAVLPPARFGELRINNGLVDNFKEKPQVSSGGWINGGFGVFERKALDLIDPTTSLERGLLEPLSERGELAVYEHPGWWQCCDTVRELDMLNELWNTDKAPWKVWAK